MKSKTICVVDDNPDIRLFLRTALEAEGFQVHEASSGIEAISVLSKSPADLILLDLIMGQPDGLEVCAEIRKTSSVPIIILTSKSDEIDEALCLSAGADDFITKPISPRILTLRVKAQLKRSVNSVSLKTKILISGSLKLDIEAREFSINGELLPLTRTEFEFLQLLMGNPRKVFSRREIMEAIDVSVEFSSDHLLDTHASRLRQKVKSAGGPRIIHAIRGVGFCLQDFNALVN